MRRAVALGLLAASLGCGQESTEFDGPIRVVDGRELVSMAFSVEFARVRDMVVDDDFVWVLDASPPFVSRIGRGSAESVVQFGALGQGPGELTRPVAIQLSSDGVDVWDPANGRVVTFDTLGTVVRVEQISADGEGRIRSDIMDVTYLDPWRIRRVGDDVIYARFPSGLDHAVDAAGGSLVRTDRQLRSGEVVTRYADHVPRDASGLGVFAAMPLWDVCGDYVVLWDPRGQTVRWIDEYGGLPAEVPLPIPARRFEVEDLEGYARHVARLELGPGFESAGIDFGAYARRNRDALGRRGTSVTDLRCASHQSAWLQLFDLGQDPLGRGNSWVHVQKQSAVELVHFPNGYRPFVFRGDDTVIGILESVTGQSLAIWRGTYSRTQ